MRIPREKIIVGMPSHHFMVDVGCMSGLLSCMPHFARPIVLAGNSYVSLARDEITHSFLNDPAAEWLVWIDSDTRFTPQDWDILWADPLELLVCGEYARKFLGMPPVQHGLGFTRVHRSVYEKIAAMVTEDGEDRVPRFYHKGAMMVNYHPQGAMGGSMWVGEDQGFFMWAQAAGVSVRLEKRLKLVHAGMMGFEYPNQINVALFAQLLSNYSQEEQIEIAKICETAAGI